MIEDFEHAGQRWWAALALSTLAFAERTAGNDAAADDALARMRSHARVVGVRDILFDRSEPYQIDSLLERGDLDHARAVLARLEERGRVLPRPWITTTLPAARALVASAEGDMTAALVALQERGTPQVLPQFEAAWSLYVEGRLRRRVKQKRASADILQQAADSFERLGAPTWAARVLHELDRVGLRHKSPGELTVTERRVAELAASGLTNREVASAAFMSIKTVEANLARTYRKLGIRSRAELGARMASKRAFNGEQI